MKYVVNNIIFKLIVMNSLTLLALNFGIFLFELIFGFIILAFEFILDLTGEELLALRNATIIWLSTIPIYTISWLFLALFYKYGHVWKSRGVVIGFVYNNDFVQEAFREVQENYVGHWTSHCKEDESIAEENKKTIDNELEDRSNEIQIPEKDANEHTPLHKVDSVSLEDENKDLETE